MCTLLKVLPVIIFLEIPHQNSLEMPDTYHVLKDFFKRREEKKLERRNILSGHSTQIMLMDELTL